MEYILIGIVTLSGAGLTLFSGFGLGTLCHILDQLRETDPHYLVCLEA